MSGPHAPATTVAGHFLSMQPIADGALALEKSWYRGDAYAAMVAERDKFKKACGDVLGVLMGEESLDLGGKIFDILAKVMDARRAP